MTLPNDSIEPCLTLPNDSIGGSHMTNASQTEIRVEHLKHSWTVKNFSHCYQEYLENYVNLRNTDLTWSIKIYPKGNGENNKDFVFLCLNRVVGSNTKNNKNNTFRSRFFLKNSEGKDIEMRVHPNPSHSDYVSYIKRDVLFPQIQPADSITVLVEIDVAVDTITVALDADTYIAKCECEKQLGNDYLKLFQDGLLTDLTVKVGGREIRAHKAILAARSEVFAAMFNHDQMIESKTGILDIEDIEYNVVKEMIAFIYSNQTSPDINDIATELLIAADKYRLKELRDHCEQILIQSINSDNVCNLLIIADIYNVELLRKRAIRFIRQQPKKITATSGWQTIIKVVNSFDDSNDSGQVSSELSFIPPTNPASATSSFSLGTPS